MAIRAYICGDVHLRSGDGAFLDFLQSLEHQPPARLVILGDLFEFWVDTAARVRDFAPVFAVARRLRAAGWQLDFVRGNREFTAGPHLRMALGARLHWPACTLEIGGRRIRVVHGDRLCHDPLYQLSAAFLRGFWFQAGALLLPPPVQNLAARLMRSLSTGRVRVYSPGLPNSPRFFIDPRRIVAAGRGADALIAGHVHRRVHCRVRGLEFALAGDWQANGGSYLAIDEAGRLHPRRWALADQV